MHNEPSVRWSTTRADPTPRPAFRRLRGYAFDPSLSTQMDTALVNEVIFKVPWEDDADRIRREQLQLGLSDQPDPEAGLHPGPIGEYVEVIDVDPASNCWYAPVNLNSPLVLAQDGLNPSEGNPQFHQQMVYAVAMTTIRNFERALGRFALWSPRLVRNTAGEVTEAQFIRRLRVYPHGLRAANAYYSPEKKALLFGYFPAGGGDSDHLPGGMVFTCLSHDIIAHETTHALLDGMHDRYLEPTHVDVLAFHEAIADIVALFQHFSFPEVLRHEIGKSRGNLGVENKLVQLAQEFGHAIGKHGALRDAIGDRNEKTGEWRVAKPDPDRYRTTTEPHARGAILVAAVFNAFLAIYQRRSEDLLRIGSGGTGVLPQGELHPDLVNRLAGEASKAASHVLQMCMRALDYCPPLDITFGDFFRAVITADSDLVPDDDLGYRVAFIEAFRRWGIYPRDVRTLSVDSLRWPLATRGLDDSRRIQSLASSLRKKMSSLDLPGTTRKTYWERSIALRAAVHELVPQIAEELQFLSGQRARADGGPFCLKLLDPRPPGMSIGASGGPRFEVHAVRAAQRVGPDGDSLNQAIVTITQKRIIQVVGDRSFKYRGGATLIFNLETLNLEYVIGKSIDDDENDPESRLARRLAYLRNGNVGTATYIYDDPLSAGEEPFARLHGGLGEDQEP